MESQASQTESLGGIIRGILTDVQTLIREQITLVRLELRGQAGHARAAAMSFGIAAGALLFGVAFLLVALAIGLADLLTWPAWAGFLVVALVLSLVGVITLSSGRRQIRTIGAIHNETVATLKENSEWIANRLSSVRK